MRWELLVNVIRMLQLMRRDPAAHQRTGVVIQISIASVRDVSTTAKNCGVQMEDVAKVLTMRWELLVNVIRMLQLMGRDPAAHQRTGVVILISIASVRDVSTTVKNCGVQMEDVAKVLTMRWELLVNVIRMLQLMRRDPAAHQRTGVV